MKYAILRPFNFTTMAKKLSVAEDEEVRKPTFVSEREVAVSILRKGASELILTIPKKTPVDELREYFRAHKFDVIIKVVARERGSKGDRAFHVKKKNKEELPRSEIRERIIEEEGQPITKDFKPLNVGETAIWYLISDETAKLGGARKVEMTLSFVQPLIGPVYHFKITEPDGTTIERHNHLIVEDDEDFTIIPFPEVTDDEDDEAIRKYPPLTLMSGGMKTHDILYYEKRHRQKPTQ